MNPRAARQRLRAAGDAILRRALQAADPYSLVDRELARGRASGLPALERVRGRVVVVAAGKAAVPMALAAERALSGLSAADPRQRH